MPALDGVRALSIVAVMLFHAGIPHVRAGGEGVLVFYVLSGFLITSLLLQERAETGAVRLRSFYARRALRLLPALVVMLLVVSLACYHYRTSSSGARATLRFVPAALFYVGNWVRAFRSHNPATAGMLDHTWSLSVEEQFYTIWPLAMFALWRWKGRRVVIASALVVAVMADLGRVLVWVVESSTVATYRMFGTDLACDGLLLGAALAVYRSTGADVGKWCARFAPVAWLYLLGVAVLGHNTQATPSQIRFYDTVLWPIVDVAAVIVIGALVDKPGILARILGSPIPRYVGRLSYSLYLWHTPIFVLILLHWPMLASTPHPLWVYEFLLTFAVAMISYHFIERPALRIKQRFERTTDGQERTAFEALSTKKPTKPLLDEVE